MPCGQSRSGADRRDGALIPITTVPVYYSAGPVYRGRTKQTPADDDEAMYSINGISPIASPAFNLFGAFEFNQAEWEPGIDALIARYVDPFAGAKRCRKKRKTMPSTKLYGAQ
jgi:hypothetical protein